MWCFLIRKGGGGMGVANGGSMGKKKPLNHTFLPVSSTVLFLGFIMKWCQRGNHGVALN